MKKPWCFRLGALINLNRVSSTAALISWVGIKHTMKARLQELQNFLKILVIIQLNHQPWSRMSSDWNAFIKVLDLRLTRNLVGVMRECLRAITTQFQRLVLSEAYPRKEKWIPWSLNPILSMVLQSTLNPQTISISLKIPLFDSLKALHTGTLVSIRLITDPDYKHLSDSLGCTGARRWGRSFPKKLGKAWLMWVFLD